MPTRLRNGEGRVGRGSNRQMHPFRSAEVGGTARRTGDARNWGDPLGRGERPQRRDRRRFGRESDRVVVPLRPGNAGGGKDPDFWCAFDGGEDEVIGEEPGNTRTDPDSPEEALSQGEGGTGLPLLPALRQGSPRRHPAPRLCAGSCERGRAGGDGMTFATIEAEGLETWLAGLREDLIAKTYRPEPVRRVMIPKPGGGERPLGIPTIRDRVVQTAAKLVLEPIFETDLDPAAYGYRPGRGGTDAIKAGHALLCRGFTGVVDADLSKDFDPIPPSG